MGKPAGHRFATTHWSQVLAARDNSTPDSRDALATLCEIYWFPLYAYLRRRHTAEDAQDLTQGFFARLVATGGLRGVSRERGRFRSFLLASLGHFVANERDHARALKRGGANPPVSLDLKTAEGRYHPEPADDSTPERIFDRHWLRLVTCVCEAIEYAHAHGVGHGNIRAPNVLVFKHDATPVPKVVDFGVASLISQSGSPGGDITHDIAHDVRALGAPR